MNLEIIKYWTKFKNIMKWKLILIFSKKLKT